jgi:voltage-gated potassium channel
MGHLQRRFQRFLANPASLRNSTRAIFGTTIVVVTLGALVVHVFDREEYPTFGRALWFTLQTVTTVGYGDVTPARPVGRLVAAVVMITAIGLITVVTAGITSVFVDTARGRSGRPAESGRSGDPALPAAEISEVTLAGIERTLVTISARLDQIERSLASADPAPDDEQPGPESGS